MCSKRCANICVHASVSVSEHARVCENVSVCASVRLRVGVSVRVHESVSVCACKSVRVRVSVGFHVSVCVIFSHHIACVRQCVTLHRRQRSSKSARFRWRWQV